MKKKYNTQYKKEFFDKEYSAKEAYGRLWQYARKYRFRIVLGMICGILTAGTMVPFFQVIQPALDQVTDQKIEMTTSLAEETAESVANKEPAKQKKKLNAFEKKIQKASRMPGWFKQVEALAKKCGIELQTEKGEMKGALLFVILVIVPAVALIRMGLLFLNHYCLTWTGSHVVADLRCDIFKHVNKQSMQFFGRIDVGQLMSRCTGDPGQVQIIIQQILAELAIAPFEILISIGYIIWFAIANEMIPTLCLIVIGFPVFMVPVITISRKVRKWSKRSLENSSVVTSKIHEILTCVRVVKAYNTEEYEQEKYVENNKSLLKTTLRAVRLALLVGPAVETVGIILICGFIAWCFLANVMLSNVVPMLAPLLLIYKPLKQLAKLQSQVEQGRAALGRILSILDVDMVMPEKENAIEKKTFESSIKFDNVSFRYDTAERDAVSGADFEIKRGSFVAVVGSTGSGKSTMSGLLSRFYDPYKGSVTMDGVDLRDIKNESLRNLIGSVMQETILFNDTVEENIRYGNQNATHEEVVQAAKLANAHEFIMSQPGGYQRTVGEKGFALSGGERQRIAIARAILKNPPILILDEATSALDTVTERLVQSAIDNLMSNRTTFAIAHRLSTVRNADMILVMDGGKIVEHGTHDELYAMNGVYRKLCEMQHTEE